MTGKSLTIFLFLIIIGSLIFISPVKGQQYQVTQLEEQLRSSKNQPDKVKLQILSQLCERSLSMNYELTEEYITQLEALMAKSGDYFYEAEVLSLKAQISLLNGEIDKVQAQLLSAIDKFSKKNDYVGIAFCHQHLAHYAYKNLQKDSVCYHAEQMHQLLLKYAPEKVYHSNLTLANCATIRNEVPKAIDYYEKSKEQALAANDSLVLAGNLDKLAFYLMRQNDYDKASGYAFRAVKIMEKLKANNSLCSAYLNLGELYFLNQDSINGYNSFDKSVKLARQVKLPNLESRAYFYVGFYLLKDKKYAASKQQFLLCKQLSEQYDLKQNEILSVKGLGDVANAEQKPKEAINHYLTAIKLSDEKGVEQLKPGLFLSISETISDIESEEEQVEKFIADVIALSKKEQVLNDKYNINLALKNIYERKKEFKESLKFASKALSLQDSIKKKALTVSINEIELKYENQLKEEELEKQRLVVREQQVQQNIYTLSNIFLLSLLSLLGGIFYLRSKFFKQLKLQNNQLEHQQVEISDLLQNVHTKNTQLEEKIVLQSTELMDYIMSREKMDFQVKEIQSLIKKTKSNAPLQPNILEDIENKVNNIFDQSNNWLRFKEKINTVYPNFFPNLFSAHPELTKKDLKHCAYVLIGLSVKEVCEIMFVAPKTVESTRYRLRKKMNLDANTLLKDYLVSFSKGAGNT